MNDFRTYLTRATKDIQVEVERALGLIQQRHTALSNEYELFTQSMQGGKGIRGVLVKLGYELNHPEANRDIDKVAAAFEILHASLLIHDDIIDKSLIRRGKPTVYKALGKNHYAISQAICLGDIGLFLANQLIAQSNFDHKSKADVLSLFAKIVVNTIMGEMLDVKLSKEVEKKEEDVLLIHIYKTAYYTIVGPLTIGALLGRAEKLRLNAINEFGEYIGIAFQIQDDILGVFGNEQVIGKSTTSDIEENKNTLLIAYALKKATSSQRKILTQYYGKGKLTPNGLRAIKEVFRDTGSLAYSRMQVEEYIQRGKRLIPVLTDDQAMQRLLHQFIDALAKRKK